MRGIGNYVRVVDGLGGFRGFGADFDPDRGPDDPVYTFQVRPRFPDGTYDSLSLIAWQFGQPAPATLKLWQVNRTLIGPDPHNIKVGAVLTLPAGWPATPIRLTKPTSAWIAEAVTALKNAGFAPVPQAHQPPPPPPGPPACRADQILVGSGSKMDPWRCEAKPQTYSKAGGDIGMILLVAGIATTLIFGRKFIGG